MQMTQLIAEIGLNHNGSEEHAQRMLENVLAAGIDAVTFQIREPEFYTAAAPRAAGSVKIFIERQPKPFMKRDVSLELRFATNQ